eukprot:Opistho-2@14415
MTLPRLFTAAILLIGLGLAIEAAVCSNPASYAGQSLCYPDGQYCGECVSFVKVCSKDTRTTSQWSAGQRVHGANLPSGTTIATFPSGSYSGHAAVYVGQNADGIQVWDQWVGHPVSQRTIRWNGTGISNNGDSFFAIN